MKITGCEFNCEIANLVLSEDIARNTEVNNTKFNTGKVGIMVYKNKPDFLNDYFKNGISEETLSQVAKELRDSTPDQYKSIFQRYELDRWIKGASDLSTLITNLLNLF